MRQLAFDLPCRVALGRDDFYVSASNAEAVAWIDRWPAWPVPALVLHGPPSSGKTHLLQLWCERAAAAFLDGPGLEAASPARPAGPVAVDDADRAPERALLHLHNDCIERGGSLLLTARQAPGAWNAALPDLRSRLRAAAVAAIAAPDDPLLAAVLVKHFADRQLQVRPEVVHYLVARMERSFAAAGRLAAQLDAAALSAGRPVTLALARRVLAAADQSSSEAPGGV